MLLQMRPLSLKDAGKMLFTAILMVIAITVCQGQSTVDSLQSGFKTPPTASKPRVWWHWMNGNVTREGITKDLEWKAAFSVEGTGVLKTGRNSLEIKVTNLWTNRPDSLGRSVL